MKAVVAWSSGKDSAYAFHVAQQSGDFDIVGVLTTLTEDTHRVAAHGVREELLDRQHLELGLPVRKARVPVPCSNIIYERQMADALRPFIEKGVTHVIFGDLFLADIRAYREKQMKALGLKCVFPLWGISTRQLAAEMMASGLKTILVCVKENALDQRFAARLFDSSLLDDLPVGVDPCGENGEFHTAVVAGPMFKREIHVAIGAVELRDGFYYVDVVPTGRAGHLVVRKGEN